MSVAATYFDGEFARDRPVMLAREGALLVFSGTDVVETRWTIAGLHSIDPPAPGQPFRITHDSKPGARLVVRDEAFVADLVAQNRHLKGGYTWNHLRQVAVWTLGGLAAAALVGYVLVSVLPQRVAYLLPNDWRNRVGEQIVQSLVEGKRQCHTANGDAAKSAMIAALAEGNPDLPPFSMEVYDIAVLNAFAAPGGKIIFTREILEKAEGPDEIAGILAHELGHVYYRHPEAQLVRLTGLQVLISVVSGTNGGNFTSNVAAIAALLKHSRDAEREADAFAQQTLDQATIDPLGLKRFFEKLIKLESGAKKPEDSSKGPTAFERIGSIFSTHPGTEERIKEIMPLPAGKTAITVLRPDQWTALKNICS